MLERDKSDHRPPLLAQHLRHIFPDISAAAPLIVALLLNHETPLSLCIDVAGQELQKARDKNQIYLIEIVVRIASFLMYTAPHPKESVQSKLKNLDCKVLLSVLITKEAQRD